MKRIVLSLLIAAALPACSLILDDSAQHSGEGIILVNDTDEFIYYGALELETSHRTYIRSSFDPNERSGPQLKAGASTTIGEIREYHEGDDVLLLVYAMRAREPIDEPSPDPEKAAQLIYRIIVTAEEMQQGRRVVIDQL